MPALHIEKLAQEALEVRLLREKREERASELQRQRAAEKQEVARALCAERRERATPRPRPALAMFKANTQVEAGASTKELAAQLGEAQLALEAAGRREEALKQQLQDQSAEIEALNAELASSADDRKQALGGALSAHESRLGLERARAVRAESQVEELLAQVEKMRVTCARLKTEAAQSHAKEMKRRQLSRDSSPASSRPGILRTPSLSSVGSPPSSPFMRRANANAPHQGEALTDLSSGGGSSLWVQLPSRTMSPVALRSPGGRRHGSWTSRSASSAESVE